jgi:hypothetical protein
MAVIQGAFERKYAMRRVSTNAATISPASRNTDQYFASMQTAAPIPASTL